MGQIYLWYYSTDFWVTELIQAYAYILIFFFESSRQNWNYFSDFIIQVEVVYVETNDVSET